MMKNPYIRWLLLTFYNGALYIVYGLLCLAALFKKKWRAQRTLRLRSIEYFKENPQRDIELFYCSSAGEYEQALPLIAAREQAGKQVVIFFFSPSGIRYALKRKEHRPYFLAPFDLPHQWHELLKYLHVTQTFIIRHELWPNTIRYLAERGPVHLVDASIYSHAINIKLLYRYLAQHFTNIYAIGLYDYNILKYLCRETKVHLTGDTKYDRTAQRRIASQDVIERYRNRIQERFPGKKYLLIGSAWPKDTEIILQSLRLLPEDEAATWRVFIAPHELGEEMLELQRELIRKFGFIYKSYDDYRKGHIETADVVLVDKLGILFELYGAVDLAFVGGAMHHKIHNVLEPAIFGVHVGFGPRFHNQKEAVMLVEKGLATVLKTPQDGVKWLRTLDAEKNKNEALEKYMLSLLGATEQIVKTL